METMQLNKKTLMALDSEENRKLAHVAILKQFKERYPNMNEGVMEDVENYLLSILYDDYEFVNIFEITSENLFEKMNAIYIEYFTEAMNVEFNEGISESDAMEFITHASISDLKDLADNPKNYIVDFVSFMTDNKGVELTRVESKYEDCDLYEIHLKIASHKDYTISNLRDRIYRRLFYNTSGVKEYFNFLDFLYVKKADDKKSYKVIIAIYSKLTKEQIEKCIKFRFGSTSGKPWRRCRITMIE